MLWPWQKAVCAECRWHSVSRSVGTNLLGKPLHEYHNCTHPKHQQQDAITGEWTASVPCLIHNSWGECRRFERVLRGDA